MFLKSTREKRQITCNQTYTSRCQRNVIISSKFLGKVSSDPAKSSFKDEDGKYIFPQTYRKQNETVKHLNVEEANRIINKRKIKEK